MSCDFRLRSGEVKRQSDSLLMLFGFPQFLHPCKARQYMSFSWGALVKVVVVGTSENKWLSAKTSIFGNFCQLCWVFHADSLIGEDQESPPARTLRTGPAWLVCHSTKLMALLKNIMWHDTEAYVHTSSSSVLLNQFETTFTISKGESINVGIEERIRLFTPVNHLCWSETKHYFSFTFLLRVMGYLCLDRD